jgi:hypothetical protein
MERSGQALFWTALGSIAAVAAVIVALTQTNTSGSPNTSTSPAPVVSSSSSSIVPASSPATESTHPSPSRPSLAYLLDMTPSGDLGQFVTPGVVKIFGSTYPKSISFYCGTTGDDSPGTYALDQSATRFESAVGVEANWPTDYTVGVSVVGDGRTLQTFSVSVLKPTTVNIDVVGVHLLQLECTFAVDASGTGGWNVAVAWGNARVMESG